MEVKPAKGGNDGLASEKEDCQKTFIRFDIYSMQEIFWVKRFYIERSAFFFDCFFTS